MTYIAPNFNIITTENLKIDFLEQEGTEIVGYEQRELLGQTDRDKDIIVVEKLNFKKFTKQVPLCKGPDNKYWILNDKGELKLEYIK
jgi:hypothetical protein